MIALDTQITLPVLREGFARAWSWWTGELRDSLPAAIRARIIPAAPAFEMRIDSGKATIVRFVDGLALEVGGIGLAGEGSAADIARAAALFQGVRRPRVSVRLSRALLLRRDMEMKLTAQSRLREIVGLDLDRQTPFDAARAAFDVQIEGRDKAAGRMRVALAVVKRETVAAVLDLCGRLGVQPVTIGGAGADDLGTRFDFLTPQVEGARGGILARPRAVLGVLIGLLVVVNVVLAFWHLDAKVARLSDELAAARKSARVTERLKDQLNRSHAETQLLGDAQTAQSPLAVLKTLTHALPDTVWLFDLELANRHGKIAGFAPSASDLIAVLDKSGAVGNPKFDAPITPAAQGGERFEISFDLETGVSR